MSSANQKERRCKCHHVHHRNFRDNVAAGRIEFLRFDPANLVLAAKVISGDGKLANDGISTVDVRPMPFPYPVNDTVTLNFTIQIDINFCKKLDNVPSVQLTAESAGQTISVDTPGLKAQLDLFNLFVDNVSKDGFSARGQVVVTADSQEQATIFLLLLLLPPEDNPFRLDYVAVY